MVLGLAKVCVLARSSVELRTGPAAKSIDDPDPGLISIGLCHSQLENDEKMKCEFYSHMSVAWQVMSDLRVASSEHGPEGVTEFVFR